MTKSSKVRSLETLACDAGWRNYHFVKITTEDGIIGWSEFDEGFGSPGLGAAIQRLSARVVGQPHPVTKTLDILKRAALGLSGEDRQQEEGPRRKSALGAFPKPCDGRMAPRHGCPKAVVGGRNTNP